MPDPPRYRWLKRWCVVVAVVLAGVAGLRLWTGYRAQARLDAAVAEIRDRGEPLLIADLDRLPPPLGENRVAHLNRAMANWPTVPGTGMTVARWQDDWRYQNNNYRTDPPDPTTDHASYREALMRATDDLRRAEAVSGTDWGEPLKRPLFNRMLANLSPQRNLAKSVVADAKRAAAEGRAAESLELLRLTFTVSDAQTRGEAPVLINGLVAISIEALVVGTIEEVLPGLQLDTPESRDQARRLLTVLSDDARFEAGLRNVWVGERAVGFDTMMWLTDDADVQGASSLDSDSLLALVATPPGRWLVRPVMLDGTRELLDWNTRFLGSSRNSDIVARWERAKLLDADLDERMRSAAFKIRYPLVGLIAPVYGAGSRSEIRMLMTRRCAAAAVAVKLFEAEHGRRPATLDELVPEYLAAVPRDPMRADGGPLGYRPQGAVMVPDDQYRRERPRVTLDPLPEPGPAIVYSVGMDGVDRGGVIFISDNGQLHHVAKFDEGGDFWFLLDPPPPVTPEPEAEAGEVEDEGERVF